MYARRALSFSSRALAQLFRAFLLGARAAIGENPLLLGRGAPPAMKIRAAHSLSLSLPSPLFFPRDIYWQLFCTRLAPPHLAVYRSRDRPERIANSISRHFNRPGVSLIKSSLSRFPAIYIYINISVFIGTEVGSKRCKGYRSEGNRRLPMGEASKRVYTI